MKLCRYCGLEFISKQENQRYCSPRHRDAHHNEAKRHVLENHKDEIAHQLEATRRDIDETTT